MRSRVLAGISFVALLALVGCISEQGIERGERADHERESATHAAVEADQQATWSAPYDKEATYEALQEDDGRD